MYGSVCVIIYLFWLLQFYILLVYLDIKFVMLFEG